MIRKLSIAVGASIILMNGLASQASDGCLTAKGKIANNAQPDGSTLGVVALRLGKEKLRCGIIGVPHFPSPPNFRHTIVCDNRASSDEAQAQVTFDTYLGDPTNIEPCPIDSPGGEISFSFEEESIPDPVTARGAFQGITDEGSIYVKGEYNCDGGIVMKFDGELCFDEDDD